MAKATKNGATAEASKSNARPGVVFEDNDGQRQKTLSVETFYMLDTSPKAQTDFMAHFMKDKPGGKYLKKEDALKILFQYNVGELKELFTRLRAALDEAAFPND